MATLTRRELGEDLPEEENDTRLEHPRHVPAPFGPGKPPTPDFDCKGVSLTEMQRRKEASSTILT